jgi:tetratricopeptide (TPR) repeat protein
MNNAHTLIVNIGFDTWKNSDLVSFIQLFIKYSEVNMKGCIVRMLIIVVAAGITSCSQLGNDGKVPITTSSEKAKKEFLEGRDLAEKLLSTNALRRFDDAIALDSNFATAYLNRANTSFTTKELFFYLKKAVALSEQCSEGERLMILATEAGVNANTLKQKEYLDKLCELYPNDERARYNLGGYYYGQQDYRKAIEQYVKVIEIAPEYSPTYNILGYAYRQIEKYPEAENAFKKYIQLVPGDPNPYDSYAELLMKMGRFDESIANYQKALKIDKNFVSSRIGIAADYMYKGMSDSGSAELTKLSDLSRNDGELRQALFTKMILYVDAGKMSAALKELEKQYVLGEKTNDVAALSADCGFKGALLLEMGKFADARAAYERSVQLIASSDLSQEFKENARLFLHYNLAAVALESKDLKNAQTETEIFRKAAEVNRDMNQIRLGHELAGRIALAEKKSEIALRELMQANLQDPYNLYRIALSYQSKGDQGRAKEYFRETAKFNGLPALNYAFVRMKAEKLLSTL